MRETPFLGMQVPEGTDDVSVEVLGAALDKIDTGMEIVAGNGISVTKNAVSKKQSLSVVPFVNVNAESNTEFPSSAAVAAYVQEFVEGGGTYQGQYDFYGTMAQIKAQAGSTNATGVYLDDNNVYIITRTGSTWAAAGTLHTSQVSGDSYDIKALLEVPATGGGFESGQLRLVIDGTTKSFVVTGASKAVRSVTATGTGVAVNNTDPFNPVVSLAFGAVSSGNTAQPVSGASVQTALDGKQNKLAGTSGNVLTYSATAGQLTSKGVDSVPVEGSTNLITSGAVHDALETLEGDDWVVSFAATQPTAIPGEKILWLHV